MPVLLTDADIARLVAEPKHLDAGCERRLNLRQRHGHKEADLTVPGAAGSEFRVKIR